MPGKYWRRWWVGGLVVISLALVMMTMVNGWLMSLHPAFIQFDLQYENNIAAWFEGMLILIVGLHAYDGYARWRQEQPRRAYGWLAIAVVLVLLSADEVASLHERANAVLGWGSWLSLLPLVIVFGGLGTFGLVMLWRHEAQRWRTLLIALGFSLFVLVVVQEYFEVTTQWWAGVMSSGVRAGIEEGSELLSLWLLLLATVGNTRGIFAPGSGEPEPVFAAVPSTRAGLIRWGLVAVPVFALVAVLPTFADTRGQLPLWFAAALFLLAGVVPVRDYLSSGRPARGLAWLLAGACVVASMSVVALTGSYLWFLLLAVIMAGSWLYWYGWQSWQEIIFAALLVIGAAAVALLLPQSLFYQYLRVGLVGLAVFYVHSTRLRPAHSRAVPAKPMPAATG